MTKSNESLAKDQAKTTAATAKAGAENAGLGEPSVGEVEKARNEGVVEAIRENAKDAYNYATDGQLPGEPATRHFTGHDEIMLYEGNLRLGIEEFTALISAEGPKNGAPLPEEKVYGLLALERNGQNRTDYVKAMMKRLDLKSNELPGGGPGYTNDTTNITALDA